MKRLLACCIIVLSLTSIVSSAQSDAPYVQYYSRVLGAFVIERADGSDSHLFAPDVMPDEHQAVRILGWSPGGEYFAWLSAPFYFTGGGITWFDVWVVDAAGTPLPLLDDHDDSTNAYWSADDDTLYLLNETFDGTPPTITAANIATGTVEPATTARVPAQAFAEDWFPSPDGRLEVDAFSGTLIEIETGEFVPAQRFSGAVGEIVCGVHWHRGGAWYLREDGIILAGGGCPSGIVVADTAGTLQRELTDCPLGGLCVIWLPDAIADNLPTGAPESVVPAPTHLLRHLGPALAVGWWNDGQGVVAYEEARTMGETVSDLIWWGTSEMGWGLSDIRPVEVGCYAWVFPGCEVDALDSGRRVAIAGPEGVSIMTVPGGQVMTDQQLFAGWNAADEPVLVRGSMDADYDAARYRLARIRPDSSGVEILDDATGALLYSHSAADVGGFVVSVNLLPDGSGAVFVADMPYIWRFADDTRQPLTVLDDDYVTGIEAAGGTIFAYGLDALVHVYDAQTGELIMRLNRHAYDVALSPDGSQLATAGGDGVSLWDMERITP